MKNLLKFAAFALVLGAMVSSCGKDDESDSNCYDCASYELGGTTVPAVEYCEGDAATGNLTAEQVTTAIEAWELVSGTACVKQ